MAQLDYIDDPTQTPDVSLDPSAPVPSATPATHAPQAPIPQSEWSKPGWKNPNVYGGDTGSPVPSTAPSYVAPAQAGPVNKNYQEWFSNLVKDLPVNQESLMGLEPILTKYGFPITPPNAKGERTKIQTPEGQWVRVGFGEGKWMWIPEDAGGAGGGAGGGAAANLANYASQFSDPATKQLEAYLTAQMQALSEQRQQQQAAQVAFKQRQGQAQEATDRLTKYLQERAGRLQGPTPTQQAAQAAFRQQQAQAQEATGRLTKYLQERAGRLQGPAYTGAEQEILRTQALDPLERDRQAAKQRALQNIGARGMDPTSGIAQELLNQVDRAFDQQRAATQGQIGYRQVQEQRSREQEAQALLGYIPQVQRAANAGDLEFNQALDQEQRSREQEAQALLGYIPQAQRAANAGDLEFLQALDAAVNRPAEAQLPLASMLYQLPRNSLHDALAAMGMGGTATTANDLFNQAMGLYGIQQQARQQAAQRYGSIFQALPYVLSGFGG